MKDLFKNYHKHKVLTNMWILSISAILAVSVNSFLLSGQTGEHLKASVIEATVPEKTVDFWVNISENSLSFYNSKDMQEVVEISFSLAYDSDIADIVNPTSSLAGANITEIKNEDGFVTYILTFSEAQSITAMTDIIQVATEKKEQSTSHVNIINVNFTDASGVKYILSAEGIMF